MKFATEKGPLGRRKLQLQAKRSALFGSGYCMDLLGVERKDEAVLRRTRLRGASRARGVGMRRELPVIAACKKRFDLAAAVPFHTVRRLPVRASQTTRHEST